MASHNVLLPGLALVVFWNFAGFVLVAMDKRRARQNEWRIKERTFFLWALAFGTAGILLGMYACRHKTRQRSFSVGIPIIGIFNLVCVYLIWRQLTLL